MAAEWIDFSIGREQRMDKLINVSPSAINDLYTAFSVANLTATEIFSILSILAVENIMIWREFC